MVPVEEVIIFCFPTGLLQNHKIIFDLTAEIFFQ